MASHFGIDGIPNIVLIGVPDTEALREASEHLSANKIPHWDWYEPDYGFRFTDIATAGIRGEQRKCLEQYRLWTSVIHPSPSGMAAVPNTANVGSNPTG